MQVHPFTRTEAAEEGASVEQASRHSLRECSPSTSTAMMPRRAAKIATRTMLTSLGLMRVRAGTLNHAEGAGKAGSDGGSNGSTRSSMPPHDEPP